MKRYIVMTKTIREDDHVQIEVEGDFDDWLDAAKICESDRWFIIDTDTGELSDYVQVAHPQTPRQFPD